MNSLYFQTSKLSCKIKGMNCGLICLIETVWLLKYLLIIEVNTQYALLHVTIVTAIKLTKIDQTKYKLSHNSYPICLCPKFSICIFLMNRRSQPSFVYNETFYILYILFLYFLCDTLDLICFGTFESNMRTSQSK